MVNTIEINYCKILIEDFIDLKPNVQKIDCSNWIWDEIDNHG